MEKFFSEEIHDFIGQTLNEIEQRKNGIITDMMRQEQAIKNIPFMRLPDFSEEECKYIWKIHQSVLGCSFAENNNEVAIVCDLDSYVYNKGFIRQVPIVGTSNEVNILANDEANEIIKNAKNISIFITHNHPSSTTFSLDDMLIFIYKSKIRLLSVVGNDGHVECVLRNKNNFQNDILKNFMYIRMYRNGEIE